MNTTYVRLTDDELALMDDQCREKIQEKVNLAKLRVLDSNKLFDVPDHLRPLVVRVLEKARENGKVVAQPKRISSCDACNKDAGYAKYKRSGKYHRRGEPNFDKPLTISGIEFAHRFVVVKHRATIGCCHSCFLEALPFLRETLARTNAKVSESLRPEKSIMQN